MLVDKLANALYLLAKVEMLTMLDSADSLLNGQKNSSKTNTADDLARAQADIAHVAKLMRWRNADKEPPPKDGTPIVLREEDNNYTIVRWVENDDLAEGGGGGWYILSSIDTAFLLDEDIGWMSWRPFVP